jgi:hypothetical protein
MKFVTTLMKRFINSQSDLQDPALNGEYWQLCRELDEVDQEIFECRKGEKTNGNQ